MYLYLEYHPTVEKLCAKRLARVSAPIRALRFFTSMAPSSLVRASRAGFGVYSGFTLQNTIILFIGTPFHGTPNFGKP